MSLLNYLMILLLFDNAFFSPPSFLVRQYCWDRLAGGCFRVLRWRSHAVQIGLELVR